MRFLCLPASLLAAAVCAQSPPAPPVDPATIPADTVVATIGDRKLTAGEVRGFVASMPNLKENFALDKKEFLRQYALLWYVSQLAEKDGLPRRSPFKERLEYARMQLLVQAYLDEAAGKGDVNPAEQRKFYEANLVRYKSVKTKVIYIAAFPPGSPLPEGRTALTPQQARAKAEDIVKQLRAGADFSKLAREVSDDKETAAKGGDYSTIRFTDGIPDAIKLPVLALNQGEVTAPLEQPNGYYIFRAEEVVVQPYEEAKDQVFNAIKDERFQKWFGDIREKVRAMVRFDNDAFFAPFADQPPAPAASPKP